jgi:hypothetical protein
VLDPYQYALRAVDLRIMSAGLPYLRRRQRWLTGVLLPALVLRALIPFGFMPVVAGGGLAIGFCPGAGLLPLGIAATHHSLEAQHQHAGHSGGAPVDPGSAAHHAPCLFATSATAAFAPAVLVPAENAAGFALRGDSAAEQLFPATILRAQSSRGPPLLA